MMQSKHDAGQEVHFAGDSGNKEGGEAEADGKSKANGMSSLAPLIGYLFIEPAQQEGDFIGGRRNGVTFEDLTRQRHEKEFVMQ